MQCMFLSDHKNCRALSIEKAECENCRFFQTLEEYYKKKEKIKQWYRRRGIDYNTYLENLREDY